MHITIYKYKKNITYLSQFKKKYIYIYILLYRKYNYINKIFLKINFKFYYNITTHNQIYK